MTKNDLNDAYGKYLNHLKCYWENLSTRARKMVMAGGAIMAVLLAICLFAGSSEIKAMERVLTADLKASASAQTAEEVVRRMRAINLNGCPAEFKTAYMTHIHAWESMGEIQRRAAEFQADNSNLATVAESFIRGYLGDPLGKANEIRAGENQLKGAYEEAADQVRITYQRVEEIAVERGAKLPKRQ